MRGRGLAHGTCRDSLGSAASSGELAFRGFPAKIPEISGQNRPPLDRRGPPGTSTCTKNQPRRQILMSFCEENKIPPDAFRYPEQGCSQQIATPPRPRERPPRPERWPPPRPLPRPRPPESSTKRDVPATMSTKSRTASFRGAALSDETLAQSVGKLCSRKYARSGEFQTSSTWPDHGQNTKQPNRVRSIYIYIYCIEHMFETRATSSDELPSVFAFP